MAFLEMKTGILMHLFSTWEKEGAIVNYLFAFYLFSWDMLSVVIAYLVER